MAVTRDLHNLGDCGGVPKPAALESWGLMSLGDCGGVVAVPTDFGSRDFTCLGDWGGVPPLIPTGFIS